MADKEYTLFELHFDGGFQIGPKALGGEDEEADAETEEESVDITAESGGGPGAALIGLVALVVVAALLRRLLGSDEDLEVETPDEGDVEEIEPTD